MQQEQAQWQQCRGDPSGLTYPETSLTISRTKAVRLLRWPLVRETRGLATRAVVFCSRAKDGFLGQRTVLSFPFFWSSCVARKSIICDDPVVGVEVAIWPLPSSRSPYSRPALLQDGEGAGREKRPRWQLQDGDAEILHEVRHT